MVTKEGGLSAVARKIYTVLLWEAQQQMRSIGQTPDATHLFEMPIQRAVELAGSASGSRTLVQGYLKEMRKQSISWEAPGVTAGVEWADMALLSQVAFTVKHGVRHVQWAFPPDIVKALLEPKLWTLQDLQILAQLESYSAIALYDICSRYRNNPSGVTNRATPEWWVDALSSSTKKREWRKVKNESVQSAVEEINSKTDIAVELIEHRVGRAVSEVQFAVRKKHSDVSSAEPTLVQQDSRIFAAAKWLKISESQLTALAAKYSDELLLTALTELNRRVGQGADVRNHLAYLKSILSPSAHPAADIASAGLRATARESIDSLPMDDGAEERSRLVQERLDAIPADKMANLLIELTDSMRTRGLLTPSIARRLRDGDWNSPLIKSEISKMLTTKDVV